MRPTNEEVEELEKRVDSYDWKYTINEINNTNVITAGLYFKLLIVHLDTIISYYNEEKLIYNIIELYKKLDEPDISLTILTTGEEKALGRLTLELKRRNTFISIVKHMYC